MLIACHDFVSLASSVYINFCTCIMKLCMQALVVLFIKIYRINLCCNVLIFVPVEVFMNEGNQMKHPCTHAHTHIHIYILYTHTMNRQHAEYIDLEWASSIIYIIYLIYNIMNE